MPNQPKPPEPNVKEIAEALRAALFVANYEGATSGVQLALIKSAILEAIAERDGRIEVLKKIGDAMAFHLEDLLRLEASIQGFGGNLEALDKWKALSKTQPTTEDKG